MAKILLVGADPEFFLRSAKYGTYKSAVGLIGGSKEAPLAIDEDGHAILEDNVAVEFNIRPAESVEAFKASIHKVLNYLKEKLPDFEFSQESAISFPKEELNTPEAQMFGCEPDYNAWTGNVNQKPCAEDQNLRSAGGHIHVGHELAVADPFRVIRSMDLFLGVPSVVRDNGVRRRALYGAAGCCRPKPYGVEYRTLSNFWIFDDSNIEWAYAGTQRALEFVGAGNELSDEDSYMIQRCINNNDHNDYAYLSKKFGL